MVYVTEVKCTQEKDNVAQTTELRDLLGLIEPYTKELSWTILWLWATGDLGAGKSIPELEREIEKSPTGLQLSWDDLRSLAGNLWQVIDGTFVGRKEKEANPSRDTADLCASSDIVIEMVDSSFWRICTQDKRIIEALSKRFPDLVIGEEL